MTDSASAATEENSNVDDTDSDHLDGLEDGAGCTEIWEHLSERRDEEDG